MHSIPIVPAGVRVGRAPDNDLVLSDVQVSWGHAEFWAAGGIVYVRDRGSTNGTFLNGWPCRIPMPVRPSDEIRLGTSVELRVENAGHVAATVVTNWLVEDVMRGVRLPFADALPGLECPGPDGSLKMEGREISVGEIFEVSGRQFRVAAAEGLPVPTAGAESGGWPYRLYASLDGPTGPEAVIEHRLSAKRCEIRAVNRAVMLYILARRVVEDHRRHVSRAEAGWCTDDDVVMGIWGREGASMDTNGLHVLIHRVRRDIETAGLDPAFLEKRQRALRIALVDVTAQ